MTGAFETGHLGNGTLCLRNSTYRLSFTITHTSSSIALNFRGMQDEAASNEGWALDNVLVSVVSDEVSTPKISPTVQLFPNTNGGTAYTKTFTIKNETNSERIISNPIVRGTNSSDFTVTTNNCNTLSAGASCTIQVSFSQQTAGLRGALLEVTTDDPVAPLLTAAMTNYEDRASEAQRRVPPVMSTVKVYLTSDTTKTAVTKLTTGENYTVEWKLEGYGSDYRSYATVFNCETNDNNCGESDSNASSKSNTLSSSSETGNWSYDDQKTKIFTYNYSFTAPASGKRVVLRFYQGAANDLATGHSPISLLLPGNLGIGYFDKVGRRLSLLVQ